MPPGPGAVPASSDRRIGAARSGTLRRRHAPEGKVVVVPAEGRRRHPGVIRAGREVAREALPGDLRRTVERPPLEVMLREDPSEAVRSSAILATCAAAGFTISELAGAGGSLLLPVLMNQISTFDPRDWRCTSEERHAADDRHAYAFSFRTYERCAVGVAS